MSALLAAAAIAAEPAEEEPWRIRSKSSEAVRTDDGGRVISFRDDVVILHGDLVINADAARYLDGPRRAMLTGHVVMTQDSTVVRAPYALYDRESRVARFPNGIVIERPTGPAIADAGWWWRDEEKFELRGRAAAADAGGTLDADAMTVDTLSDVFWAVGKARLVDDSTGVVVEAENLRYDRAGQLATAIGAPRTTFVDDDSATVVVTSERMTYDPRANVAVATGDVHVRRGSLEATAGEGTFWRDEDRFVLADGPQLVEGATVVTGESVELRMVGPGRREVRVHGSARIANRFLEDRERPAAAMPEAPDLDATRERVEEEAAATPEAPAEPPEPGAGSVAAPEGPSPEAAVEGALEAAGDAEPAEPAAGAGPEPEPTPAWLTIPSQELPTENLLFGDDVLMEFVDDSLQRVRVIGHSRSKFFPNEETGELTEWNDVKGDTLHVWFTDDAVDSVVVLGRGSGEYRLPAGADAGATPERLRELGKLVHHEAPNIRWLRAAEMMHLDQGAKVDYKTMTLTSGRIDFDAKRETMEAGGEPSPQLVDRGDEVAGETMRYHLPSEKGEILRGKTQFENGYYTGTDIWRMGDNELAVRDAQYTTCDLEHSHYHFACKEMKIYPDDKMVAKPVILKVREIPIFALPYYMTSIGKGRRSGFLLPRLELGVDDARGRFIRNLGYYWAPTDYNDAWASFDFYPEREQIVSYLNARYHLRYRFRGRASVKYNRDVTLDTKETAVELEHSQTFSDTMELRGSGRFVSSSSIYQNIDDQQRLDRELKSRATLSKRFESNRSLNVEVEREENLDTGRISETLPLVVFTQPSRPFAGRRQYLPGEEAGRGLMDVTYYSVGGRFVNDRLRPATGPREDHVGSQVDLRVSSTAELSRFLNLSPSVSAEGAWIDVDKLGNKNALRATYGASVAARTNLYGTFLGAVGPVRGLRHVITPSVTWGWAPEFEEYLFTNDFGQKEDRFFTFGGIGGTRRKTNSMNLSVTNLLQTKLARGGEEKRYDVFNVGTSISYNFLAKDTGARPLSSLSNRLTVLTALPVNQTWAVAHDPYSWDLLSSSVTTRARLSSNMFSDRRDPSDDPPPVYDDYGDPAGPGTDPVGAGQGRGPSPGRYQGGAWSFDASHSMQLGSGGSRSSNLVFNSRWSPTSRWEVVFDTQYDLRTGVNTRQSWSVVRIIHCWELSFSRRLLGGDWQYSFRINITDIPDIQAERGQFSSGRTSTSLPGQDLF